MPLIIRSKIHALSLKNQAFVRPTRHNHPLQIIADRGPGGEDESASWVLFRREAGFDEEIPGALRTVRVDAFEAGHIRRKT